MVASICHAREVAKREPTILGREGLSALLDTLRANGYQLVGPVVRAGAIAYEAIAGLDDLPAGWSDSQEPGRYRLSRNDSPALFAYTVGPQSWKKFLPGAVTTLWQAKRQPDGGFVIAEPPTAAGNYAFIGVRPCELAAISIQDRVLQGGEYCSTAYLARRQKNFLLAVNCTRPGGTCFCHSWGTGPKASANFDLVLTELLSPPGQRFLLEIGSATGAEIAVQIPQQIASPHELAESAQLLERASHQMGRTLATAGVKELLARNIEHPHWESVAERCLGCANCTMVCPTCFCTTLSDTTNLTGDQAERVASWDSCFTLAYSYLHGGSVRSSRQARYRQWLTHKLSNWFAQFGEAGCVGCGRCITWCPVGIDLTAEVGAL
ncbi:MAG: 4Fe-4S dicluster domain-containing protein [Cyanobacteria bacterium NC_groundwater_1444_Ag_S-0.65um_54_12]|nr:4Fe-4S dicluster domain-containing protein [Cyanobacteria bacterium NC_groundwater_1444_Ag_S-0.65um_54_12]